MLISCNLLLELLHIGFDSLRVIEEECYLSFQFIDNYFVIDFILRYQSPFFFDINYRACISTIELSNIIELIIVNLLFRFKLLLHFVFNFIPFSFEYFSCLFYCYFGMVSLNVFINCILQGLVSNKLIFLLIENC
jgi:hypothetical protein